MLRCEGVVVVGVFGRVVQGFRDLRASQLLESKLYGLGGSMFGLVFAGVFLYLNGLWYVLIALGFGFVLQFIEFVSVWKQWEAAVSVERELEGVL